MIDFYSDMQVRLSASSFLNFVYDSISQKIKAHKSKDLSSSPLKYAYFSGHDTTMQGYMKGIEAYEFLPVLPPFATQILIDLFYENNSYFVTWSFND